ncbi:MAG: Hsp20 family protein [Burkholderiaceae bacterium]|nr:Hsp20 family protein [Burkholderiaceae bacterium]
MNAIIRREPFGSLVDDFLGDFFNRAGWSVTRSAELPAAVRARMDVIDKGDKYTVSVDLPGVKKEDIQVSVEGPRLSIRAENKSEREVKDKDGSRLLHQERFATSYARSVELPDEVTDQGAEAVFDDGVLRLTLPKRAQAVSKRLTVQ